MPRRAATRPTSGSSCTGEGLPGSHAAGSHAEPLATRSELRSVHGRPLGAAPSPRTPSPPSFSDPARSRPASPPSGQPERAVGCAAPAMPSSVPQHPSLCFGGRRVVAGVLWRAGAQLAGCSRRAGHGRQGIEVSEAAEAQRARWDRDGLALGPPQLQGAPPSSLETCQCSAEPEFPGCSSSMSCWQHSVFEQPDQPAPAPSLQSCP